MLAASIGVCNGGFCLKALPCPQFFVRDGAYRLITAITQVGTSFRMAACGATASFARAPSKDRSQTELPTLALARQPFFGQALGRDVSARATQNTIYFTIEWDLPECHI